MSALSLLLEKRHRTQAELAALIGSRSRASELMAGKRLLTKKQIALINLAWGIPIKRLFAIAIVQGEAHE